MGFKLELINNEIFKSAFESIEKIVDDVNIHIDSEGFHINAIDRSHICFVSLDLNKEFFDEFECDVAEKICIDTIDLMKILKRMKKTDVLCLSVEDETNNLILNFKGDVDREFKIRLIDASYEAPPLPNIVLPVGVKLPSSILNDCLNDMQLFNDNLTFTIDNEYFIASADGEFGDSEVKYLHGEHITDTVQASFTIDKLADMMKSSKFSDEVKISMDNDKPLRLDFELVTEDGILSFLLAPRLSNDDE